MPHSADGDWFWNGREWIAARSPDRAWWWDGKGWVPAPAVVTRFEYQETPWTRRIQLLILALTVLGLLVAVVTIPALTGQLFQQSVDRSIASQPGATPAETAQLRQFMTSAIQATLATVVVLTVGLYAILLVGLWKLWRWVYWYFLVIGFLAVLALPQDIAYALGIGPYRLPLAVVVPSALQALVWLGLSIWMLVLYRRYGTWARIRVAAGSGPESAPAHDPRPPH